MPRLLTGPETFAIVLTQEGTGRILRRATVSAQTAQTICKLVDGAGELGANVAQIVNAGRGLEAAAREAMTAIDRAFAPLLAKPRKLPARRKR